MLQFLNSLRVIEIIFVVRFYHSKNHISHIDYNMENAGGMSSPCLYTTAATHAFTGCVEYPTSWTFDQDEVPANLRQIESKRKCWQTASSTGFKQSEAQISTIHAEAGKGFSSSFAPQPGYTYNVLQCSLNTAGPSDMQRPDLLE